MRARVFIRPAALLSGGGLLRSTVIMALVSLLNGCISLQVSEQIATRQEPQEPKVFFLTADEKSYTVSRWWGSDYETVSIKRSDLPAGCETARFFLNDSAHELKLMEPFSAPWIKGREHPPLPDDSYPLCALLVSYGSFSGAPELDGMAATSSMGMIAKGDRQKPQPAVWALTPAAMMVEGYAMVGAMWTLPVWGPILFIKGKNEESRRKQYMSELPPPVTACWNAIDDKVKNGWFYDENIKVSDFEWPPDSENIYDFRIADELFSAENATPIDTQVNLYRGRIKFRSQEAEADVECSLNSGQVVAIKIKPLM